MLQLAIASGKGGTGKTTLSTSLARVLSSGYAVNYVDCDVEAPNGALFLKPKIEQRITAYRPVPDVGASRCDLCGECSRFCRYHAITVLRDRVLVFPELCHGCGGCTLVCPRDAITEHEQPIGTIELGSAGEIGFARARLAIGETASVRLIHELRRRVGSREITILDAPPGSSCPVVTTVNGADVVVLVTEPTPFGLHDLEGAVRMVRQLEIPLGVVINRVGIGDEGVERYCREENVPIWGRILDDRRVAEAYSRGEMPGDTVAGFREQVQQIAARLRAEAPA